MSNKNAIQQAKGLKDYHQRQREAMYAKIDQAIRSMREEGATITKKALAEELGVVEKTLYSRYVKEYLLRYKEFNPALEQTGHQPASDDSLKELNDLLKLRNRELSVKNKELVEELKKAKADYSALNQRYERVLGVYQDSLGSKIVPL